MFTKRYGLDCATSRHNTEVSTELQKAIEKFPLWPNDMFHALTIIQEEVGELSKAVLQFNYEVDKGVTVGDIRKEAIQSICMLHRFLNSLDRDKYILADTSQHEFDM
jgi:NTP pyrophosphatase (non-canonical NTP hydrolase)